jgi:hypothetical protein
MTMESPAAFILVNRLMTEHMNSALPNAPVVPDSPRRTRHRSVAERSSSWLRLRAGLAATLQAAARTVAPPERPQLPCQGALSARG